MTHLLTLVALIFYLIVAGIVSALYYATIRNHMTERFIHTEIFINLVGFLFPITIIAVLLYTVAVIFTNLYTAFVIFVADLLLKKS